MSYLNKRYDTDEKRGWFVWSIIFGVILGFVGSMWPTLRDAATLILAALLILIGFRWFVCALLDSMYGVNQDA